MQEVAGTIDDVCASSGWKFGHRELGDLDSHATIGATVQVEEWSRRDVGAGVLHRLKFGVLVTVAERGAVVAECGLQIGGVAQTRLQQSEIFGGVEAR